MNIESLRDYCLAKAGTEESFPFGPYTIVFKTKGKIYLLCPLDKQPLQFNGKCDPEYAVQLREEYPQAIFPGYHMNKKHWNTVICNGTIPSRLLLKLIDHSYELVAGNLAKRR